MMTTEATLGALGSNDQLGAVSEAGTLAGLWPHISADENGCATLEWWNGTRKLTLYCCSNPFEALLKVWGPNINAEIEFVPVLDSHAVRKAFQWLADAPSA
jgi:hypothetical protein